MEVEVFATGWFFLTNEFLHKLGYQNYRDLFVSQMHWHHDSYPLWLLDEREALASWIAQQEGLVLFKGYSTNRFDSRLQHQARRKARRIGWRNSEENQC